MSLSLEKFVLSTRVRSAGVEMSPKLHLVRVPVMTQKECDTAFLEAGYKLDIDETKVCAGWPQGGKDACQVSPPFSI